MKQLKVTHFVLRNHCQGEEWNVTCVAEMLRSHLVDAVVGLEFALIICGRARVYLSTG